MQRPGREPGANVAVGSGEEPSPYLGTRTSAVAQPMRESAMP